MRHEVPIKGPGLRKFLKNNFPKINLDGTIPPSDLAFLRQAYVAFVEENRKSLKSDLNKEKGIEPGCMVENSNGKKFIVAKIRKDGFLIFKGKRGLFNPRNFSRVL